MTARKRQWLNKFYPDSQELKPSTLNISWSSSESESEVETIPKKIKTKHVLNVTSTLEFNEDRPDNNDTFNVRQTFDSPVLNSSNIEGESPILTSITNSGESLNNSPIIAKTNIFKEVRCKYKQVNGVKKSILNSPSCSPDIFDTESSQLINSDLSILSNAELYSISPTTSVPTQNDLFEPSKIIDNFPSQTSSQVVNYASTCNDLYKTDSSENLYQFPVRRKKRYKKGGLASILEKTIRLHKTRLSIWQHEIYKNKTDMVKFLNEGIITFKVNAINSEYGIQLLECYIIKENDSNKDFLETILITIGSIINVNFSIGSEYKLFPPYKYKNIPYKSKEVCCYFGVCKILSLDIK